MKSDGLTEIISSTIFMRGNRLISTASIMKGGTSLHPTEIVKRKN
jgi:hypothetical protein